MFDSRMGKTALWLLAAAALAGCGKTHSITVGAVPDDYRTRHPIVISEKEEVLDLPVGPSSRHMTAHQKEAIEGFLADYGNSGGAPVTVLVPQGSLNAAAAAAAANDFASLMQRNGVPGSRIQMLAYQAAPKDSAPIRISYPVVKASVGPCGRWPEDLAATHENKNYENFGCSYQNNLAAQVANPADFLGPRKMTSIDAENRDSAIGDYKERETSDRFWERSEVDF